MLEALIIGLIIVLILVALVNTIGTFLVFYIFFKAGGFQWLKNTIKKAWDKANTPLIVTPDNKNKKEMKDD